MVLSSVAGNMIYMQVKKCRRVLRGRLLEITEGSKDRDTKKTKKTTVFLMFPSRILNQLLLIFFVYFYLLLLFLKVYFKSKTVIVWFCHVYADGS